MQKHIDDFNTRAIVLKTFPYGETSLISRCFTKEEGKISFIIKGARSKKSPKMGYFQPLSYINLIYNSKEKRQLQLVSKVSYIKIWSEISMSLKKILLAQNILEITDFVLEEKDPHPALFDLLVNVIHYLENDQLDSSTAFWLYECTVLSEMGFAIDLNNNQMHGVTFPNPSEGDYSYQILENLITGNIDQLILKKFSSKDRKIVSNYLSKQLCYHFDGFDKLKSFKVTKDVLVNN